MLAYLIRNVCNMMARQIIWAIIDHWFSCEFIDVYYLHKHLSHSKKTQKTWIWEFWVWISGRVFWANQATGPQFISQHLTPKKWSILNISFRIIFDDYFQYGDCQQQQRFLFVTILLGSTTRIIIEYRKVLFLQNRQVKRSTPLGYTLSWCHCPRTCLNRTC